MRIVLPPSVDEGLIALARELLPAGHELIAASSDEELVSTLPQADVLMGPSSRPLSAEALAVMGNLKLVQLWSAGYDAIDVPAMRRLRLPVATNGGANAVGVAEHTVMLMLAVYRDLATFDAHVKDGLWRRQVTGARNFYELTGKTVGIVGLGIIGREVAKHLRGFEVRALYHDVFRPDPATELPLGVEYAPLAEMLAKADVVTLHAPLTPQTHHLINRETLRAMKQTAILINTARGGLVDHTALYEALKENLIAGAGLDVTEPEPPPADFPLFTLPNVTLTPHVAGSTVESWPRRLRNAYANILRVAAGQKPLWVIPELRGLLEPLSSSRSSEQC